MASRKPEIEALAWEQVRECLTKMAWFQNLSHERQETTMRRMIAQWNKEIKKLGKKMNDEWKAAKAEEAQDEPI